MSMSTNSTSSEYFYIPTLLIDVPNAETCREAMCPHVQDSYCTYSPRFAEEVVIPFTLKNGKCKEGQYTVSPTPQGGLTHSYEPDIYPTRCTFSNEACAKLVCNEVQHGNNPIDAADDGKSWTCLSDRAIAKAAGEGKYWFANQTNPCEDASPKCTEIDGRSYDNIETPGRDFTSGSKAGSIPGLLLVIGISSAAVALLGLAV